MPNCAIRSLLIFSCLLALSGCDQTDAEQRGTDATRRTKESRQAVPADVGGGNWPGWRGPQSRGHIEAAELPEVWPEQAPKPSWHFPLGTGWSSPIESGGVVYVTDRKDGTERVFALNAETGEEIWQHTNPVDFDPHQVGRRHGNGPKSTPVVSEGKVYSLGIAGWLQCLDAASGREIWNVNLPREFGAHEPLPRGRAFVNGTENVIVPIGGGEGAPVPLFGYTGSLVVSSKQLIVPVGGANGGTITSFDKATGKVLWKSLHENVSYSSPIVATLAGVTQVVVMTGPRVVGLDVKDGRLLWSFPYQISYDESIGTPAVAGDLVLITGYSRPLTALEISREGDDVEMHERWTSRVLSSYVSSVVCDGDYVYGMNDGGELACLRLTDGSVMWRGGNHGTYCSPIVAGDELLGLNEFGELLIFSSSPAEYREIAKLELAQSDTWTMPAVVGSRIYIRSAAGVSCFDFGGR